MTEISNQSSRAALFKRGLRVSLVPAIVLAAVSFSAPVHADIFSQSGAAETKAMTERLNNLEGLVAQMRATIGSNAQGAGAPGNLNLPPPPDFVGPADRFEGIDYGYTLLGEVNGMHMVKKSDGTRLMLRTDELRQFEMVAKRKHQQTSNAATMPPAPTPPATQVNAAPPPPPPATQARSRIRTTTPAAAADKPVK